MLRMVLFFSTLREEAWDYLDSIVFMPNIPLPDIVEYFRWGKFILSIDLKFEKSHFWIPLDISGEADIP